MGAPRQYRRPQSGGAPATGAQGATLGHTCPLHACEASLSRPTRRRGSQAPRKKCTQQQPRTCQTLIGTTAMWDAATRVRQRRILIMKPLPAGPARAREVGLRLLQRAAPAALLRRYRWATIQIGGSAPLASRQREAPGSQVEPADVSKSVSSDSLIECAEQTNRYPPILALTCFFVLPCHCFDSVTRNRWTVFFLLLMIGMDIQFGSKYAITEMQRSLTLLLAPEGI